MLAKRYIVIVGMLAAALLSSCSFHDLHQAQNVVKQADSLRAEGQMYSDSLTLAQACETLGKSSLLSIFNYQLSTDYAHACYHYGRLLREKDNPVSAMQAFIHATHTRSRDYFILGRVYSNMGDICHLANEFDLSYEMFGRSADCFLANGDSIAYYYALNDMAFELAEQAKKEETLILLAEIEKHTSNIGVLSLVHETRADAYLRVEQYDSAIYYAKKSLHLGNIVPTCMIIQAQSFTKLGMGDSALFYARNILENPYATYQNKFNALYVVARLDSMLCADEVRTLDSWREDIRYDEYEPEMARLTASVRLLQMDLARKPDWRWLYIIAASICFVLAFGILLYLWHRRKQFREISKDLQEKKKEHVRLEKTINDLSQRQETQHLQLLEDIEAACEAIRNSDMRTGLCWHNYDKMCSLANGRLYGIKDRLRPFSLSEKEFRLCVLIVLQAETRQMVEMIPYAHSGIGKFKYTTAKKLGTTTGEMRSFIINLIAH